MIIYQRNIDLKLLLVRLLFLLLAIAAVKAFDLRRENLGYFLIVSFLFTALISVSRLSVYHDRIEVLRWYFFGLIPVKWAAVSSLEERVKTYRMFEEIDFHHTSGPLSFIFIFFSVKYKFQGIRIKCQNSFGVVSKVNVKLSDEEYQLVKQERQLLYPQDEKTQPHLFEQEE